MTQKQKNKKNVKKYLKIIFFNNIIFVAKDKIKERFIWSYLEIYFLIQIR